MKHFIAGFLGFFIFAAILATIIFVISVLWNYFHPTPKELFGLFLLVVGICFGVENYTHHKFPDRSRMRRFRY